MTLRPAHLLLSCGLLAVTASAQITNDECTGAIVVPLGTTLFDTTTATLSPTPWTCGANGGAVSTSPDIWYEFTAPNNANYIFDTCGSSYDTSLTLYDGTCASLNVLVCNDDQCGVASLVAATVNAGTVLYIRVGGFDSGSFGPGMLTVTETNPRAVSLVAHYKMDDTGTTCEDSSGNNLSGTYMGGMVGAAGASAATMTSVDFDGLGDFAEILGDPLLDALLNDFSVSAWFHLDGSAMSGSGLSQLQRIFGNLGPNGAWSFGVADANLSPNIGAGVRFTTHGVLDYDFAAPIQVGQWHHIAVVMDISNTVELYLDGTSIGTVAGNAPASTPNGTYNIGAWWPTHANVPEFFNGKIDDIQLYGGTISAMDVAGLISNPGSVVGSSSVGVRYCSPNVVNSSGAAASISANGTPIVASNDITLTASAMPLGSFGFFLTSPSQGLVMNPGGSQGHLCLSGAIGRFVGPGQITSSGMTGEISLAVDLGQVPTPTGLVQAQAGQTMNFQAWFRDFVGGMQTSNFSDGVSVILL